LEHGDLGVFAVEVDGGGRPLSTDRVAVDDRQFEVGEAIAASMSQTAMPTFSRRIDQPSR
jgi:hypothetical protein